MTRLERKNNVNTAIKTSPISSNTLEKLRVDLETLCAYIPPDNGKLEEARSKLRNAITLMRKANIPTPAIIHFLVSTGLFSVQTRDGGATTVYLKNNYKIKINMTLGSVIERVIETRLKTMDKGEIATIDMGFVDKFSYFTSMVMRKDIVSLLGYDEVDRYTVHNDFDAVILTAYIEGKEYFSESLTRQRFRKVFSACCKGKYVFASGPALRSEFWRTRVERFSAVRSLAETDRLMSLCARFVNNEDHLAAEKYKEQILGALNNLVVDGDISRRLFTTSPFLVRSKDWGERNEFQDPEVSSFACSTKRGGSLLPFKVESITPLRGLLAYLKRTVYMSDSKQSRLKIERSVKEALLKLTHGPMVSGCSSSDLFDSCIAGVKLLEDRIDVNFGSDLILIKGYCEDPSFEELSHKGINSLTFLIEYDELVDRFLTYCGVKLSDYPY